MTKVRLLALPGVDCSKWVAVIDRMLAAVDADEPNYGTAIIRAAFAPVWKEEEDASEEE